MGSFVSLNIKMKTLFESLFYDSPFMKWELNISQQTLVVPPLNNMSTVISLINRSSYNSDSNGVLIFEYQLTNNPTPINVVLIIKFIAMLHCS